jgi:hypothetical protein
MSPSDHPDATAALVDSPDLSRELLALCSRFSDELFGWLDRAIAAEAASRRVPLKVAVAEVHYAMAERLLYPTLLRHAELVPPGFGGARARGAA